MKCKTFQQLVSSLTTVTSCGFEARNLNISSCLSMAAFMRSVQPHWLRNELLMLVGCSDMMVETSLKYLPSNILQISIENQENKLSFNYD